MPLRTTKTWFGVVLDAPDGPALAHFYARLLGWTVFNEDTEGAAVAPSSDAGFNLACQTERHYTRPVWPTIEGEPQMSMHCSTLSRCRPRSSSANMATIDTTSS